MKNSWGGVRKNAGRPNLGRKRRVFYLTEKEFEIIKKIIEEIRKKFEKENLK
jgi:hypothetical protein